MLGLLTSFGQTTDADSPAPQASLSGCPTVSDLPGGSAMTELCASPGVCTPGPTGGGEEDDAGKRLTRSQKKWAKRAEYREKKREKRPEERRRRRRERKEKLMRSLENLTEGMLLPYQIHETSSVLLSTRGVFHNLA